MNYADIERAAKDGTPLKRKEFVELIKADGFVSWGHEGGPVFDFYCKGEDHWTVYYPPTYNEAVSTHGDSSLIDLTVKLED